MDSADKSARRLRHEYIGTEHILLGLIQDGPGKIASIFKNLEIDLMQIEPEIIKLIQKGVDNSPIGKLPLSPRVEKVIEYSRREAKDFQHPYVELEDILLGISKAYDGVAAQILMNLGLNLENIREETLKTYS